MSAIQINRPHQTVPLLYNFPSNSAPMIVHKDLIEINCFRCMWEERTESRWECSLPGHRSSPRTPAGPPHTGADRTKI